MRRRSYVPGKEAEPGRDQVPSWPLNDSSRGPAVQAVDEPAVPGISRPGQRQLRSRPAFVPLSDYAPAVVNERPQPGPTQDLPNATPSELAVSGRDSSPAPYAPWTAVKAALTRWFNRLQAELRKQASSGTVPRQAAPEEAVTPIVDETSFSPVLASDSQSMVVKSPSELEELLPAWLAPAAEAFEPPSASPVSPEADFVVPSPATPGEPDTVAEPRRRSIASRRTPQLARMYTGPMQQTKALWQRMHVSIVDGFNQWQTARRQRQVEKQAARPAARYSPKSQTAAMEESAAVIPQDSQRPGAPPPVADAPDPIESSPGAGGLAALRQWIRAHLALLRQKLEKVGRMLRGYLQRRARILIPALMLVMILFMAARSQRLRQILDPNPPVVEVLVAGPVVRDLANDTLTVPLRIVLDDDDLDSIDQDLIDEIQISYGETAEVNEPPLAVTTVDDSGDPLTRVVEVTLPGSLAGRQIMLQAATSRRQDQVRLSFAAPPAFEIRKLGAESSQYYDEQGLLRLEVDGSIKDDDGRYAYEWLVTTTDSSDHASSFSLMGSQGELLLTLDATQPCSKYTVTLLARSDTGNVSWSQERRACRRP